MMDGYDKSLEEMIAKEEIKFTIERIKELIIEFEKSGKQIEDYFDDDFTLCVRNNYVFNKTEKNLPLLKEYKIHLENLILLDEIEKINLYLDRLFDNDLEFNQLNKIVEIVIRYLNKINSTNETNKYFNNKEYIKFFNKVYYLIKLTLKYNLDTKVIDNIYIEINLNKEMVKIINELIKKEFKIIEKSTNVNKNTFNDFIINYLEKPINNNILISYNLIRKMLDCFDNAITENLIERIEQNLEDLKELNTQTEPLLKEYIENQQKIDTFITQTKPNYKKELKKKILSALLSLSITIGIGYAVEEISYKSIQNETSKQIGTTAQENSNAKMTSMLLGLVCGILISVSNKKGAYILSEEINKLIWQNTINENSKEELEKDIKKLRLQLKELLEDEEEKLNIINTLLDEILITSNNCLDASIETIIEEANDNINTAKLKKIIL